MNDVPGDLGGKMLDGSTRLTRHARRRWDDRAPKGACTVRDAWHLSVEVTDSVCQRITDRDGNTPDRARVFKGTAARGKVYYMVFICCDHPKPYNSDGTPAVTGPRMDDWTNVVTTYRTKSVPSSKLREDLEAFGQLQEVVG